MEGEAKEADQERVIKVNSKCFQLKYELALVSGKGQILGLSHDQRLNLVMRMVGRLGWLAD